MDRKVIYSIYRAYIEAATLARRDFTFMYLAQVN